MSARFWDQSQILTEAQRRTAWALLPYSPLLTLQEMLLSAQRSPFGIDLLTHLPTKPPNPRALQRSLQGLWEAQPGQSGPQRHLVASASRPGWGARLVIGGFLVTALMSTSFYSLQGSFTSSYIQLQGTKEGREGNAQKKNKKERI